MENQIDWGSEKRAFLSLVAMKGVGFHTLWQIAESKQSFAKLFDSSPKELLATLKSKGARLPHASALGWHAIRDSVSKSADQLQKVLSAKRIRIIFRDEKGFPRSLLHLEDPPQWLFVQGDIEILSAASITIVGTRQPTADGLWLAQYVGLTIKHWGKPTVSGLALGVDQAIHDASIAANLPTIAVLGTGITADYPKNIGPIREKIVDGGGAVITEYLPDESYSALNFVRRNRLQAALGRVLIPVEWKERSGTAHTVRFAAGLNRAIAGLRLSSWEDRQVALPTGPGARQVFTIPGQDEAFRSFVERGLHDDNMYRQDSFV